ncbi:DMBT1 [Mytilus edulis]|uniref:DMBT1 n=1 Tax=Mytilus edulis TaxID=6550 RepID=A0A8S3U129_MYTED|nr:DMBT1 [Mytilus edulis]
MASRLSQEEENYVRMSLLLIGISPRAARVLFDREFSPTYVLDSKTFDVTLMTVLLRNLTNLNPPYGGYDILPPLSEVTPSSDLARIKYYRNILAHLDEGRIDNSMFNKEWDDITGAVGRLGGQSMKQECDNLKTKILDQTNQEIMLDIKRSNDEIRELKQSVDSLKIANADLTEEVEKLKDTVPWNIRGVKLVGGNGPYEGTVELNVNGQWGTICGKTDFDINDADFICRMAGYPRALQFYTFSHFGKGNGSIVLSNPHCSGKEDIIDDCGSNGWYYSGTCTHNYDAGVVCQRNFTGKFTTEGIRFVGGAGSFEGRVELNINGQWGTICDTNFDLAAAEVLCRMAGYSRALQFFYGAYFGEGTGPVFLDRLGCSGNEKHLDSCSSSGLFASNCQHSHDIGISCQSIRFVDGAGPFEGRVELNINGQWGTICDKKFGLADAEVLCRMAGALQAFVGAYFGEGTGPVFLENLGCSGNEKHLDSCSASGLFSTSCRHSHDVGVACLRVRLVDGFKQWEGRVELKVNGQWGTICGYNGFDLSDAQVVCRMAGFSTSGKIQAFQNAYFGRGIGPVLLGSLNCVGHESHLDSCISLYHVAGTVLVVIVDISMMLVFPVQMVLHLAEAVSKKKEECFVNAHFFNMKKKCRSL